MILGFGISYVLFSLHSLPCQMCLFVAKPTVDGFLWNKHEGDGKFLTPVQSITSGFLAACIGPVAT